ncbi:MAG TPA: cyclase family protein [Acidimicrobiales bacterium]|nr:cyclase family protein [Acidimicrobiales bacterium]
MTDLPSYEELPNGDSWHLWPGNEVYGTLNLLTPERARAAAALVQTGDTFALNWDMELPDPPLFGRGAFEHEIVASTTHRDDVLHHWNTQSSSQWDGLRHVFHPTRGNYGGLPDEAHGIHFWAQRGIVGRGVLVDIGRWREANGTPLRLDRNDPIETEELDACLDAQGVALEPGDVMLLRTGWIEWYESMTPDERVAYSQDYSTPGMRPGRKTAAWLWNKHISALGADNPAVEVMPHEPELTLEQRRAGWADKENRGELFGHIHFLPLLGIPLGEMFNLGALAAACAADGRYACMFTSAPLNLRQGVASPPNALAIR